jgi:tRNA(Leu) C34 or U34 (ribose-2'-O)-methylase TrmL
MGKNSNINVMASVVGQQPNPNQNTVKNNLFQIGNLNSGISTLNASSSNNNHIMLPHAPGASSINASK